MRENLRVYCTIVVLASFSLVCKYSVCSPFSCCKIHYFACKDIIKMVAHSSCWQTPKVVAYFMINVFYSFEREAN